MSREKLNYSWIILIGVILIRGFAGGSINMTAGLYLSPVSQDIGAGIGTLSIYLSITSIVLVIWLPVAGKLMNKYDIRIMVLAGAILQTFSFIGFGFMNSVFGWYVLAIPQAMGSAILASLLGPIMINRWFVNNPGLMMGIQMAFVSLFGAVFQPVTSGIIGNEGWRTAYFVIGGISFVVIVLTGLLLLKNRPEKEVERGGNRGLDIGSADISENQAVHSASFYFLLLFMICITGVGVFTQHVPTYGSLLGFTLKETGTSLAFSSVGSALGSIAIGIICDKIGSLKTCYGMIGIGIIAVICFIFSFNSLLIFRISAFLHGLIGSGIMVLAPILTLKFYGQKDYEKIFAKVSMGAPLASIVLIPVYGFIYDTTKSYWLVLTGMLALLVISVFSIYAGWRKRCKDFED